MIPLPHHPAIPASNPLSEANVTPDEHLHALDRRRGRQAALSALTAIEPLAVLQHAVQLDPDDSSPGYVEGYVETAMMIARATAVDLLEHVQQAKDRIAILATATPSYDVDAAAEAACRRADDGIDEEEDDEPEGELDDPCTICKEEEAEDYKMCASCLHNARRSGWNPGDPS